MGGSGSTRWGNHVKKTTVEECRSLDLKDFYRKGALRWGVRWSGSSTWTNSLTGAKLASIGVALDTTDQARPWLRLSYTITDRETGEKADYDYRVPLTFAPLPFGGGRWWVICPLVKEGQACGRRVGKLYLPPGGRYFGCRHCYDLTYRSCQESDRRVGRLLGAMFSGDRPSLEGASVATLGLYLKAYDRIERRLGRLSGR